MRAVRRSLVAGIAGLVLTASVLLVPDLRFAYRSERGHLVLETAATMVAALVALLFFGRFRRGRTRRDLLLVWTMAALAVAAFGTLAVPGTDSGDYDPYAVWGALLVRFLAAVLLLLAAVLPPRRIRAASWSGRRTVLALLALAILGSAVFVLGSALPGAVAEQPSPEASALPQIKGHPLVLAFRSGNLGCFAIAALVFTARAQRDRDDLLGWIGVAAVLGAWARANYLLFPSLYEEWLYTGDLFRLGFYLLLLVGAVREIQAYWSAQAELAAARERRRLARDLHDGVVQELGDIRRLARLLQTTAEARAGERITLATDRALDEARRSVEALAAAPDERLADALRRSVREVADRHQVAVQHQLEAEVLVPATHREALVRIAREAVGNAARHAKVQHVSVTLTAGELTVRDNGRGFDAASGGRPGGFGLTSMRERAEGIGASLRIESMPERGTKVTVSW